MDTQKVSKPKLCFHECLLFWETKLQGCNLLFMSQLSRHHLSNGHGMITHTYTHTARPFLRSDLLREDSRHGASHMETTRRQETSYHAQRRRKCWFSKLDFSRWLKMCQFAFRYEPLGCVWSPSVTSFGGMRWNWISFFLLIWSRVGHLHREVALS